MIVGSSCGKDKNESRVSYRGVYACVRYIHRHMLYLGQLLP